jgi:hypothetical protein
LIQNVHRGVDDVELSYEKKYVAFEGLKRFPDLLRFSIDFVCDKFVVD